ncbi:lipopolysaccharide biosynthesis protein [Azohydromonas sediminis]|uniref:lipopolysaccharide biosynthesis protein n=1 Tax=Azohydromonas sediminis TaxID=2259674 RepID=UPI000E65B043|nr:hypothetical protein [Azohydromonas sediminis]
MNVSRRSAASAILAQAVGKGVAVVAWTALISWAARQLSAAEYGQFMLLANLVMLALPIGSFGQPQVILHLNGRLGTNVRTPRHHAGFLQCTRLMAPTSIVVALALGLATFTTLHNGPAPMLLALACSVWVLGAVWQAFMAEEAKTVSHFWVAGLFSNSGAAGGATTLCFALVGTAVVVGFAGQAASVLLLVTMLALGSAASAVFLVGNYWRDPARSRETSTAVSDAPWGDAQVRRAGVLVTVNVALTFVVGQSDLWWAARLFGVEASGQYATASYLARFCSLSGILMSAAFAARFAGMLAGGDHLALSAAVRKLALGALLAGAVVGALLLGAHKLGLLDLAFRLTDDEALLALFWLSLGHIVGSLFGFGPVILGAAGNFRDLLVITALAAGLTTALAGIAATFGDLATLAMAYAAGYVAFTYTCHRRAASVHRVRPFRSVRVAAEEKSA